MPLFEVTEGFDIEKEIKKLSTDKYLEMTILPLLQTVKNKL